MIITMLNGGIGNQMFQYALGRVLALNNKTELKLDLSIFEKYTEIDTKREYELDIFNIKAKKATVNEIRRVTDNSKIKYLLNRYLGLDLQTELPNVIREKSLNFQKSILALKGDLYLIGYWQSEKYFKDYSKIIKNDFTFKRKPNKRNSELLEKIEKTNSVSIHVRRADYVKDKKTNEFHGVLGSSYYKKAANLINKRVKKPVFFIFSDDIAWCKKNFKFLRNATFINHNQGKKSYEDMRLMSNCKHNIVANSSFSWWAAWLNDNYGKIIVAPKKWFRITDVNSKDLVPSGWLRI